MEKAVWHTSAIELLSMCLISRRRWHPNLSALDISFIHLSKLDVGQQLFRDNLSHCPSWLFLPTHVNLARILTFRISSSQLNISICRLIVLQLRIY